jgi:hypothetical protein
MSEAVVGGVAGGALAAETGLLCQYCAASTYAFVSEALVGGCVSVDRVVVVVVV